MTRKQRNDFLRRYGPCALIAGSVEGMGAAYARTFAGHGLDLVLLDRDAAGLKAQARELRSAHGVAVRAVPCDLADTAGIDEALDGLASMEIGMMVYNAALGHVGAWLDVPLAMKQAVVSVNVQTPLVMVDRLSRPMADRGHGGIILTSSMSALRGAPRQAIYAATKAFELILAETLWAELREHGVDVLAFVPGMVKTPSFERSGASKAALAVLPPVTPEQAVAEALAALGEHPSWIPGRAWRASAELMGKLVPRRLAILAAGRRMRELGRG